MSLDACARSTALGPPTKLSFRKPFVAQPKPATIIDQQLDRSPSAIAENKDRAAEGIARQHRAAKLSHAIDTFSEVGRLDGHKDPHLRGNLNHSASSRKNAATIPLTLSASAPRSVMLRPLPSTRSIDILLGALVISMGAI